MGLLRALTKTTINKKSVRSTVPISAAIVFLKGLKTNIESKTKKKKKILNQDKQINLSSKDSVKEFIHKHNFWPFFTQRPFNKVVNPNDNPKCIVVSLADSSPLANDLSYSLAESKEYIISALSNLKKLTDGQLYVAVRGDNFSFLSDYDFINLTSS